MGLGLGLGLGPGVGLGLGAGLEGAGSALLAGPSSGRRGGAARAAVPKEGVEARLSTAVKAGSYLPG